MTPPSMCTYLSLRFSLPFSSHFWLTKRSAEISQNPHFTTLFIYDTFRISFRLHSAPAPHDVIEWVYIFLICSIELVTGTKCSANIDTFCVFSKFVCTLPPNWVTEAEAVVPETDVESKKKNPIIVETTTITTSRTTKRTTRRRTSL